MPTTTASPRSGRRPADGPASCSSISSRRAPASSRSSPSRTCWKPATTSPRACSASSRYSSPIPPSPAISSSAAATSCTWSFRRSPPRTANTSSPPSSRLHRHRRHVLRRLHGRPHRHPRHRHPDPRAPLADAPRRRLAWSACAPCLQRTFRFFGDFHPSTAPMTMPDGSTQIVHRARALPSHLLLMLGNQSMYQKFFSAKSEKAATRATVGWVIGTVILESVIVATGRRRLRALPHRRVSQRPREIIAWSALHAFTGRLSFSARCSSAPSSPRSSPPRTTISSRRPPISSTTSSRATSRPTPPTP